MLLFKTENLKVQVGAIDLKNAQFIKLINRGVLSSIDSKYSAIEEKEGEDATIMVFYVQTTLKTHKLFSFISQNWVINC